MPGKPLFYASTLSYEGFARGVLVESHLGRPTKLEGNPLHPDSLGASDAITQAAIYQLYDPTRSRLVLNNGLPSSWSHFNTALKARLDNLALRQGEGLRLLSRPIISPSFAALRRQISAKFPKAVWHQFSPLEPGHGSQALLALYGRAVQPVYDLRKANVIVAIESDFLSRGPGAIAYARAFGERRQTDPARIDLNRLYALEASPTITGATADHRLPLHPAETVIFTYALYDLLRGVESGRENSLTVEKKEFLRALAHDLRANRGRSLIIAGPEQSASIHTVTALLNDLLGNTGTTVTYVPALQEFPEAYADSIAQLTVALNSNSVSDLIILDCNAAYSAPGYLAFPQACRKAPFMCYLGSFNDETAQQATWHIPMADELESWGDLRAYDGTVSLRQPAIAPLYNGISDYELCLAVLGRNREQYDEVIRDYWKGKRGGLDFDAFWHTSVQDGVMAGTAFRPVTVTQKRAAPGEPEKITQTKPVMQIRPDPRILDGRFSNNSWLQELPKPVTQLTWGNAALLAPPTAEKMRLADGDVVRIAAGTATVEAPVCIVPGQAAGVLTVHLGYGTTRAGNGLGLGFNASMLQNAGRLWLSEDITITKTVKKEPLAVTQHDGTLNDDRQLLRHGDVARYIRDPQFARDAVRAPQDRETLYKPQEHLGGTYQWAMCIDISKCTGCGACTMACQVENNIAVVGKREVIRNRQMHWIRVDRYFSGSGAAPEIYHQPVPCMHCEDAPCELVCPVEATSHSQEGLNEMTYNRCIGTRYCSNNCPYKVRRFNFFDYNKLAPSQLQGKNPDVTIRSRGIMEKCTYCLQRINKARITAKKEGRRIRDGEVVTACQQACPTGAIFFGDIRDKGSQVNRKRAQPLNYAMMAETGVRPQDNLPCLHQEPEQGYYKRIAA